MRSISLEVYFNKHCSENGHAGVLVWEFIVEIKFEQQKEDLICFLGEGQFFVD
jgi:hypothetical protein